MLQTADGALSQVTSLLNRAVTLATEAATSNITGSQANALDTEFQSILSEVNQIGQTTNFNGLNVFAGDTGADFGTTSGTAAAKLTTASTLAVGSVTTITDNADSSTVSFTATLGNNTIADLNTAIAAATGDVATAAFAVGAATQGTANKVDTNNLELKNGTDSLTVTTSDTTTLASMGVVGGNIDQSDVFLSDGSTIASAANTQIKTNINALSSTALGLASNNLQSATTATAALTAVNSAITAVSAQRGVIGASVNRLTAASGDMSSEVTNLQSATNSIQNADIGKTVANMTQYNVLQSTGMAALQQSNQAQQAVLKLVQ